MLDEISRDICEQRKMIASLQEAASSASARAESTRLQHADAVAQVAQLKAEIESEKTKRIAADNRARLAQKAEENSAGDDDPPEQDQLDAWKRAVRQLIKNVRRRHKTVPTSAHETSAVFCTDDLVPHLTGDEFMQLGMIVTLTCLVFGRTTVVAERKYIDANLPERVGIQMVDWFSPLLHQSKLHQKLIRSGVFPDELIRCPPELIK